MIAVLNISNNFYEINEDNIVEISKDEILTKQYSEIPLIYLDDKRKHSKLIIYDKKEDDTTIIDNGQLHINSSSYFTLIEEFQDKKIVFYVKKGEMVSLFRQFSFSYIIPFEYFLIKQYINGKYSSALNIGIVGDEILALSPMKNIESLSQGDSYFIIKEIAKIKNILKMPNKNKIFFNFITNEELLNVDESTTLLSAKDFIAILQEGIKKYSIEDKYSFYYQSKNYRILAKLLSVLFVAMSVYFFYYYTTEKIKIDVFESKKSDLQAQINKIIAKKKKYEIHYIYKLDNPFIFEDFIKQISPFIKDYNVKKYLVLIDKNKLILKLDFSSLKEFLRFKKRFDKEIKRFRIYKAGSDIKVEIIKKERKKH